ncbi:MAG TPA: M28 family peptidase [Gemmatimonadales bacterium]|nr:M28 family peptidase [Gemmatimonadales bacterium]
MRRLLFAAVPLLAASSLAAQAPAACATVPAIDSVSLLRDVFRLADDSMGGRHIGTIGAAKARDYLAARFDALGLGTVGDGRLQRVPVIPSPRLGNIDHTFNVIGLVRGTAAPEKYIVVTAHYDHVGIGRPVGGDSLYNGADDNASGAAALAVLAQHFQRAPTRHSLLFVAVDGEERGMWGSRGFVEAPPVPLERIVLNVNLDMIGRNTQGELYAAGPGRYPQLKSAIEAVTPCAPVKLRMGHDTDAAGRGSDWTTQSDHAAFHRKGIPFLYFGVEDHPDYHRPSDSADRLMPAFYINAVRTIAMAIREVDGR